MELDELKNRWSTLDDRLKKQEILKENIIKKMMYEKADKSLNKLINYSIFGLVAYVGTTIFLIYILCSMRLSYTTEYLEKTSFLQIMLLVFIIGLIVSIIFGTMNFLLLSKINYSNPIRENIEYAQQYKIRSKKLILAVYAVFVPLFFILLVGMQLSGFLGTAQWTFIVFLIIAGTIYSIWEYKRFYKKNIQIIHESLEELKDLEEDK